MLHIEDKAEHDPVCDLYLVDAYMRWALLAAEEVIGERGLGIVLREAGLGRLVGNYPPAEQEGASTKISFGDYASLSAGLYNFFGRAARSMVLRIGRISTQHGIKEQGAAFNVATLLATKVLPAPARIRIAMENMQRGYKRYSQQVGQDQVLYLEDRGDSLAYVAETCPVCAGKLSDGPMCALFDGVLAEAAHWITGRDFAVHEVECRAMGAQACVWEIAKQPNP
jgi:predicted hydrocarbon binding protein